MEIFLDQLECSKRLVDEPFYYTESFVITSFNVLASTYAHQHRSLYPHVPDVLLSWGSRKMRILQELDFASPDIICLQVQL